jgi:hypothetical protein
MAKLIYQRSPKEESLIKNSIIERMFMSVCTDEQMQIYINKAQSTDPAIRASATFYASMKVERLFKHWRDEFIKQGDLDYLNWKLWSK